MHVLVTGGAGYIGTHTLVALHEAKHQFTVIDNFSNSCVEALNRVEKLTNTKVNYFEVDICNFEKLKNTIEKIDFDCTIHFAGLKAVGESNEIPLKYYENNVSGSINLFKILRDLDKRKIVFSSSATVYGIPENLPLKEDAPTWATNPYGRTKHHIEWILKDLAHSNKKWEINSLRYFNPVGAHPSGLIGEDPQDIPNNLMPFISQVAIGRRKKLSIFGNDYKTKDGTCIRDFIHVNDLAKGHVAAINNFQSGFTPINLGTGMGFSVLEIVKKFESVNNVKIPYEFVGRREGDVEANWADSSFAQEFLGWKAELGLDEICAHTWNWQQKNPKGFRS